MKKISNKISIYFAITTILVGIVFYFIIPNILNYPPDIINTEFNIVTNIFNIFEESFLNKNVSGKIYESKIWNKNSKIKGYNK